MNVSQPVAGRSRNVEAARAFLPAPVISATADASSPHPPTLHGWKFALLLRIWSGEGPKGNAARSVLTVLLWNSDGTGRTWLGIPAIMEKSGLGNERTVRRALEVLTNGGWLKLTPQTWSSLTAEQLAVGRKAPRRGDVGQAPNLYTVLASPSQTVTPEALTRPGLTRTTGSPVDETPRQICRGGQGQIGRGEPGADLPPDPNHLGSVSRMESAEGTLRAPNTHDFSKALEGKGDWDWLDAWNLLVHAHAEKTKAVYGVAPLPPDLKRDARQAVAECLDGTTVELAAKLRARGIEREFAQVRQDLAGRVMALYFKRDVEHLRRVKHALRDLPREFHARITEAMQAILQESHDAKVPRRMPELVPELEQPAQGAKAETAAKLTKSDAAEKPLPESMPVTTAREARRLMEVLNSVPSREEPSKSSKADHAPPSQPTRPTLPEWLVAAQEPAQDLPNASQAVQRSMGRVGAPRWGALPPAPTKIRRVSRLQLPEPDGATESTEPHPRE